MINMDIFLKLKERMKNNFPMLLEIYLRDAEKYIDCIERNLTDGDWDEIIIAAHSFKSASGSLGVLELSETADKIESDSIRYRDCNEVDATKIADDFEALKKIFFAVEPDLRSQLQAAKAI